MKGLCGSVHAGLFIDWRVSNINEGDEVACSDCLSGSLGGFSFTKSVQNTFKSAYQNHPELLLALSLLSASIAKDHQRSLDT